MTATIERWLAEPPPEPVARALARLAATPDVHRIAVMPDVHLAHDVCIGVATATRTAIFPEAVGGDIGCGITAARFDIGAKALGDPTCAREVIVGFARRIPQIKHAVAQATKVALLEEPLSSPSLERDKRSNAAVQLGTVGQGNHFVELQVDEDQCLWAMVHSGSRAMGPSIRDYHIKRATGSGALCGLVADTDAGKSYLSDHDWAVRYAAGNRAAMVKCVRETLHSVIGECAIAESFDVLHNFVRLEEHDGEPLWVHRKGVISARASELGVVAGSMGAPSFHVEGRGVGRSLSCCSHGAGRRLSRTQARQRFRPKDLLTQMDGVWFDDRAANQLLEEAPLAYKDIRSVMRAQKELVRVRRVLLPILSYKGV